MARALTLELELVMIVARSEEHQMWFVECGGIEAVSSVMSTYIGFAEVQIVGCKALINMGKGHGPQGICYSCGALQAIVDAMNEHKVKLDSATMLVTLQCS